LTVQMIEYIEKAGRCIKLIEVVGRGCCVMWVHPHELPFLLLHSLMGLAWGGEDNVPLVASIHGKLYPDSSWAILSTYKRLRRVKRFRSFIYPLHPSSTSLKTIGWPFGIGSPSNLKKSSTSKKQCSFQRCFL
jgi:hypothetical protein